MLLLNEIDGFRKLTFSVLGSFLAPFWSPGGSLGEPFCSKNVRRPLTQTTFRPLKIIQKCYKVVQNSPLFFFAFSFFNVFQKIKKIWKKRQHSFLHYLIALLLCFRSLGEALGTPWVLQVSPQALPGGPLSPVGAQGSPLGAQRVPPRSPRASKRDPFGTQDLPSGAQTAPAPRPIDPPTTQPHNLQNRAGGMRGAIE